MSPKAIPAAKRRTSKPSKSTPDLSSVPDFSTIPELYAMKAVGQCLSPVIEDGAELVFSQTARPQAGDFVAVYLRPELVAPDQAAAVVKRLFLSIPSFCSFPYTANPGDDAVPVVACESLNPPRRYMVAADKLQAVHKCVGIQRNGKVEPISNSAPKVIGRLADAR